MTNKTDTFFIQYKQELALQEINANKRILKGFIWFLISVAFIWILNIIGFFEVNKAMVNTAFIVTIILFSPTIFLFHAKDLSKPWIKYLLLTLLCVNCAVIISILSYHAVLLYVFPLLYAIQYRKKRIVWFAYSINLITILTSSIISFYYGICDLNILLQSQHVRSWYLNVITNESLNIPFNENPLFVIIVFMIFPRAIILFAFSIMMQYTVISNTKDALRIAQLTYYKDTDTTTNVFNKNKYEEMISKYYPSIDNLAVIFWDLNNLKTINDKYGHAMGDYAIEKLSSVLNNYANETRCIYRVGGDEFVMVLENPSEGKAESISTAVSEQLRRINDNEQIAIHSAVGFAYGKGKDIIEIAKEADAQMYINKRLTKGGIM